VNTSFQLIPKLDFTVVRELKKYQPLKHIDIANKINDNNKKYSHRSNDEYIDKLKFQLKYTKNKCLDYKKKNKQLKKIITMLKQHYQYQNSSISTKDIEGIPHIQANSVHNDSIEPNMNSCFLNEEISIENFDCEDNDSDFNYVIKEYNRSVCI
jgi:hypothetical protein